jgi:hypothetical protein
MSLTVTITPGKRFGLNEKVSSGKLNQLGQPTAALSGTAGPTILSAADYSGNLAPGAYFFGVDTGAAGAAVVIVPFPITGYTDGMLLTFRAMFKNTGPSTLQVKTLVNGSITNTFGAQPVYKGSPFLPLGPGDWVAGQIVECRYRLDADLIQGADYSSGGTQTITVIPGLTYQWTKGTNDTRLNYISQYGISTNITVSGQFTPSTSTVTLTGTDNLPSGGTLVAVTGYWQMMDIHVDPALQLLRALRFH